MIAIVGLVLLVIAAILNLIKTHPDLMMWLIIIGAILIAAEVVWGWRRAGAGYYRRGA